MNFSDMMFDLSGRAIEKDSGFNTAYDDPIAESVQDYIEICGRVFQHHRVNTGPQASIEGRASCGYRHPSSKVHLLQR